MTSQEHPSNTRRPSILSYAMQMAEAHVDDEEGDISVYLSWEGGEVRLIEVVEHAPISEEPLPFRFAAQPERKLYYPVVVLLVNADAWNDSVDKSELLPDGWRMQEFSPFVKVTKS
ncbi:hypothetical protein EA187_09260 [Lujinxingia sediminis]|uniref:Uncharacterized protein n=1 Tax=Lujinxingia sediminis TaxID=2480984 RepID=A0ABY0CSY9_9DELT|nr:hypothetical protein [Lujinxingia sediminis]RVU44721.1 hypothetical protein EA187_09260 [Lujinxingia sediminis]